MEFNNSPKGCKVYVGNLPWRVTWPILKDHMRKAGEVVRVDIFEDAQGRSKGCGLVEYATSEEAQEAIKILNDTKIDDRLIFVREDREEQSGNFEKRRLSNNFRKDRFYDSRRRRDFDYRRDDYRRGGDYRRGSGDYRRGGGDYRRGGGDYRRDDFRRPGIKRCSLAVCNLPPHVTWKELKDLFKKHGRVIRADVKSEENASKEITGIVIMENEYDAKSAIEALNFCNFEGYILKVQLEESDDE